MVAVMKPIHRVVTCFILSSSNRIALFHRCSTMPSFPNHWAGISGTIELNETPYQAAQRELSEETNLTEVVDEQGGLYLNVPYISPRTQKERIIRVYPFIVKVSDSVGLTMRGTEHDGYKFVSIEEFTTMEAECVPGLVQAFHRATYGRFDSQIPGKIMRWASDKVNGASVMTQNALQIVKDCNKEGENYQNIASNIAMLRPSMVPIVNVMNHIHDNGKDSVTMDSFLHEIERCVTMGRDEMKVLQRSSSQPLRIATFSRSGTLLQILQPYSKSCEIICSQSTPGDEGELMARDLNVKWIHDVEMEKVLASSNSIDVFLVGSDCILPDYIVNKVGTERLCTICHDNQVPVFCCADKWKVWDDIFPPPIESDLFEFVPRNLVTKLLLPK